MPWYLATYKYVQLQLNQCAFVCLFNFHTIQQENKRSPCHRIDFSMCIGKMGIEINRRGTRCGAGVGHKKI